MNRQNLQQKSGMSFMIKMVLIMVKVIKVVPALNLKKITESTLCDYSDAYILVMGDITAVGGDGNTDIALKSCAPFTNSITHINNEHIDAAENIDITMLLYNLIEYSDNYSDTSGILWKYKRHELPVTNDVNPDNFSANN